MEERKMERSVMVLKSTKQDIMNNSKSIRIVINGLNY